MRPRPEEVVQRPSNVGFAQSEGFPVLEIPDRLYNEYSISSKFLENVMGKYTIQSTGKDTLERQYNIDKPIQYMLATTRHYSWPKGAGE